MCNQHTHDLKLTTERRAHAAVRDSWPLMEYGGRLSGLLDKLGERVDAGWRAFGFKDNGWLPMGFQVLPAVPAVTGYACLPIGKRESV